MKYFQYIFTSDYWTSNDRRIVKSRRKLFVIVLMVMIAIFSYFAINTAIDYNDGKWSHSEQLQKQHIKDLKKEIKESQKTQKELEQEIKNNSEKIDQNSERLDKSIEAINNIYEKDYIGTPTAKQQSDFVSKYRYREFDGKAGK